MLLIFRFVTFFIGMPLTVDEKTFLKAANGGKHSTIVELLDKMVNINIQDVSGYSTY